MVLRLQQIYVCFFYQSNMENFKEIQKNIQSIDPSQLQIFTIDWPKIFNNTRYTATMKWDIFGPETTQFSISFKLAECSSGEPYVIDQKEERVVFKRGRVQSIIVLLNNSLVFLRNSDRFRAMPGVKLSVIAFNTHRQFRLVSVAHNT